MIETSRRSLIKGLSLLVAAPAIVKVASLMPVNSKLVPLDPEELIRRVMQPIFDRLEQQVADAVMFGQSYNIGLLRQIDRQYEEQFRIAGAKIGDTLRIQLPNDFVVSDGPSMLVPEPTERLIYVKSRRTIERQPAIPTPLALATAAVAVAPVLLEKPVTRRFWSK